MEAMPLYNSEKRNLMSTSTSASYFLKISGNKSTQDINTEVSIA